MTLATIGTLILVSVCAWMFGGIALRLAGAVIALAGLLGLSLAGSARGVLVSVLGTCLWIAGHLLYRLRHDDFKSALAERLCLAAASACRLAAAIVISDRRR
jgi:hypothetical protein